MVWSTPPNHWHRSSAEVEFRKTLPAQTCACGCGLPARAGSKYAGRGHNSRTQEFKLRHLERQSNSWTPKRRGIASMRMKALNAANPTMAREAAIKGGRIGGPAVQRLHPELAINLGKMAASLEARERVRQQHKDNPNMARDAGLANSANLSQYDKSHPEQQRRKGRLGGLRMVETGQIFKLVGSYGKRTPCHANANIVHRSKQEAEFCELNVHQNYQAHLIHVNTLVNGLREADFVIAKDIEDQERWERVIEFHPCYKRSDSNGKYFRRRVKQLRAVGVTCPIEFWEKLRQITPSLVVST